MLQHVTLVEISGSTASLKPSLRFSTTRTTTKLINMADIAMASAVPDQVDTMSRREHLSKTFEVYRAELDAYVGPHTATPAHPTQERTPGEDHHRLAGNHAAVQKAHLPPAPWSDRPGACARQEPQGGACKGT